MKRGSGMPVYLVDIELNGAIAVDATDEYEAESIADSIGLDELGDFLLESKARVLEILEASAIQDQKVFSRSDP
jgi:hypothetical protein